MASSSASENPVDTKRSIFRDDTYYVKGVHRNWLSYGEFHRINGPCVLEVLASFFFPKNFTVLIYVKHINWRLLPFSSVRR